MVPFSYLVQNLTTNILSLVLYNQNVIGPNDPSSLSDKIAQRAKIDSTAKFVDEPVAENRNVTLYRNGFTLDDGPLR